MKLHILLSAFFVFANILFAQNADVIHINFDTLKATNQYGKEQVITDFKANYGLGFYDKSDPTSNRGAIDS